MFGAASALFDFDMVDVEELGIEGCVMCVWGSGSFEFGMEWY